MKNLLTILNNYDPRTNTWNEIPWEVCFTLVPTFGNSFRQCHHYSNHLGKYNPNIYPSSLQSVLFLEINSHTMHIASCHVEPQNTVPRSESEDLSLWHCPLWSSHTLCLRQGGWYSRRDSQPSRWPPKKLKHIGCAFCLQVKVPRITRNGN